MEQLRQFDYRLEFRWYCVIVNLLEYATDIVVVGGVSTMKRHMLRCLRVNCYNIYNLLYNGTAKSNLSGDKANMIKY